MRIQRLHLSGPYRGQTMTYATKRVLFGTASDADVSYPNGLKIKERHASFTFSEDSRAFHLRAIDGSVFVNQQEIREVGGESGLVASTKALCRDLCTQASGKLKIGFPLFVIAVALGAAYLGAFMGTTEAQDALRQRQAGVYQNEITRIE